jgi:tRNA pseudouridine38-40 synthase
MRQEAKILLGRHNFKSFQAADRPQGRTCCLPARQGLASFDQSHKKERDAIRTIKNLEITRDKDFIYIDIEADGFLYNMVRNIVGTLIEIGRGKFTKGDMKKILHSRNRTLAGPTAPARGLYLLEVKY